MNFVVIIPARYASSRFPGKVLIDLGGKPMVVRVAQQAKRSHAQRVVVATDDIRVGDACAANGVEFVMTQQSHPTGTDRISEAAIKLGLRDDDIVVNVQGDEPLIPPQTIDHISQILVADPEAAMATVCHRISSRDEFFNPNVVKVVIDERGRALYFSRAPIPYARDAFAQNPSMQGELPATLCAYRHIGLYGYRVRFLRQYPQLPPVALEQIESLEQLRALAHGFSIAVSVIDAQLPPGVDTPEDYAAIKAHFE